MLIDFERRMRRKGLFVNIAIAHLCMSEGYRLLKRRAGYDLLER